MAASRTASKTKVISPTGRISFAKIAEPMEVPYLLDLQIDSFDWLIGNEAWRERVQTALDQGRTDINTKSGLEEIFEEISPKAVVRFDCSALCCAGFLTCGA